MNSEISDNAESSSKTWKLVAPDYGSLDTVWKNPKPFVLWPVGPQPLLAHWMDEAVRRGIDRVEIYVADRPAEVRAWLEDGAYWSRVATVVPIAKELDAPADGLRVDGLPESGAFHETDFSRSDPADGAELLRRWFDLQNAWLLRRTQSQPSIDSMHESGGWIGPHAVVDPSAQLTPPFWIGAGARVGAQCKIGPNAFISRKSIVDEDVEVENAFVAARTYVGRHTRIAGSIACANTLVDMIRGVRVEFAEPFILAPVQVRDSRPNTVQRLAAIGCYTLLAPLALLWNRGKWTAQRVNACAGYPIQLRTGKSGPLWMRRWPWLRHIAAGRLLWIGALPREDEDFNLMPAELAQPVRAARAGVFSLADIYKCHSPADPEEWIHASYQVQRVDPEVPRRVLRNLWRIAWS